MESLIVMNTGTKDMMNLNTVCCPLLLIRKICKGFSLRHRGGYFSLSCQVLKGGIHTTTALEGRDMEEGIRTIWVDLVMEGSIGNERLFHPFVVGEHDIAVMLHSVNLCPYAEFEVVNYFLSPGVAVYAVQQRVESQRK